MYSKMISGLLILTCINLSVYYNIEFFEILSIFYVWLLGIVALGTILLFDRVTDLAIEKVAQENRIAEYRTYANNMVARGIVFTYTVFTGFVLYENAHQFEAFVMVIVAVTGQALNSTIKTKLRRIK